MDMFRVPRESVHSSDTFRSPYGDPNKAGELEGVRPAIHGADG